MMMIRGVAVVLVLAVSCGFVVGQKCCAESQHSLTGIEQHATTGQPPRKLSVSTDVPNGKQLIEAEDMGGNGDSGAFLFRADMKKLYLIDYTAKNCTSVTYNDVIDLPCVGEGTDFPKFHKNMLINGAYAESWGAAPGSQDPDQAVVRRTAGGFCQPVFNVFPKIPQNGENGGIVMVFNYTVGMPPASTFDIPSYC